MSSDQQGRQRHLLAQTQTLAEEIRSLPLDPESTRRSHQKLIELVRLARRFVVSIDALPAGDIRNAVQAQFARALADRGDSAEATQVLARLGPAADAKAIREVASIWARRDPNAAADWAIAQEPGPAQNSALAGIVSTWANDNPRGVEDWLAQFPAGEARDRSVAAFLARGSSWSAGSAEQLAEFDAWFGLIDDPWSRAQAAVQSFWRRKERDPAGARAWLAALPNLDPEVVRITPRDDR